MSSSTIIRIKRRINEDPKEVLVLSAKKRKKDSPQDEEADIKIMKLVGTVGVDDKPEKLTQTVSNILSKKNFPNFEELKQKYKKSLKSRLKTTSDSKPTKDEHRQENRYRIVAQRRALNVESLEEWSEGVDSENQKVKANKDEETSKMFHLYDVINDAPDLRKTSAEKEKISCNGVEMIREYVSAKNAETEYGYVYDVYYTQPDDNGVNCKDFDDSLLDGLVSIQPFNSGDDLLYDEYRDEPGEFRYEDDEDSNEEDNERNEYPDEDDCSYLGDYDDDDLDLEMGVRGLGVSDDDRSGLSSDDEDDLLYTRSFDEDAAHHGSAYAKYKQRAMKELYEDDFNDELDASDDD